MEAIPQHDHRRRQSYHAFEADPSFADIVNNTVVGIHYMSRVRMAKLQRDDPFRNRVMVWCEYFAETTLMLLSMAGGLDYNRAERIEAEAARKAVVSPSTISGFLAKLLGKATKSIMAPNTDVMPRPRPNNAPPTRLGNQELYRATRVFADGFAALDEEQANIGRLFRVALDRKLEDENGRPLPLKTRFGVWKQRLQAQARFCRQSVDYFYVKKLRAVDNIQFKVRSYKDTIAEVVDLHPLAKQMTALAAHVTAFEVATTGFTVKNLGNVLYADRVKEFLLEDASGEFDPVYAELVKYNRATPWTVEYQFSTPGRAAEEDNL